VESLEIEVDATQHAQLIDHEALAFGCNLLQGLPTQQRDVFLSYVVEEERMTDIARAAKCPLQTAYSRLSSARSRISAAVKARERAGTMPRRCTVVSLCR
jgi:RNA polymerase sigma-70 factor (ECF subfamily)